MGCHLLFPVGRSSIKVCVSVYMHIHDACVQLEMIRIRSDTTHLLSLDNVVCGLSKARSYTYIASM